MEKLFHTYIVTENANTEYPHMSREMRFQTMWNVRPAEPQISLRICAV